MFRTLATAFTVFTLTVPAIAAEPGGTVTGTIDGQEVELTIVASQSDYDGTLNGSWITASLYATGPVLHQWGISPLSIGFDAYDLLAGGFSHIDVNATILGSSPHRSYVARYSQHAEDNDELVLTIEEAVVEGGMLVLSGRLTATLTSTETRGYRNPDPDDTLSIDLVIEAVVE